MMQVSVRTADRVIVQFGQSLGDRVGCTIVDLTQAQIDALRSALDQPHGSVYLSAGGVVTFDPFVAPAPPPPLPDQATFDAAVSKLRATFQTSRSGADVNLSIDAITVILRRLYRELQ